jgi:uncharacterized membrane protein YhhN
MAATLFISYCLVFTALLVFAEYRDLPRIRWIAKPLASACFVFAAVSAGALDSIYGVWVLAALILCMAGDILLIPAGSRTFLAGMGAFALGHAAYIAAFVSGGPDFGIAFLAAAGAMVIFATLALIWLWPHLGSFRWPVTGYAVIIAVMVVTSTLASLPGGGSVVMVILGTFAFALSDLAVAREKFVSPNFLNKAWGLPLYYGAQLVLAASV